MNHLFRNPPTLVIACYISFASSSVANAKITLPVPFLVETEQANQIVLGRLDENGKLSIDRALKGNLHLKDPILITQGKKLFLSLIEICPHPGSIEVLCYLREKKGTWELADFYRGVVFFHNNDVYTIYHGDPIEPGSGPSKHPTWKRTEFLQEAQQIIVCQEQFNQLLSQKPSAERIRNLVSFLQIQPGRYFLYHLDRIKRKVPVLGKEEEQAILELFHQSDFPVRVDLLLRFFQLTPKSQKAFDTVCPYLDYQHNPKIRRAAIEALIFIDRPQGEMKLKDYLKLGEPELLTILSCLSPDSPFERNPRLVEPILNLAQTIRQVQDSNNAFFIESFTLQSLLDEMGHPKMTKMLMEWGSSPKEEGRVFAAFILIKRYETLSGGNFFEMVKSWLKDAGSFLDVDYDLKTPKGLNQWLGAFKKANSRTREMLLRLWAFEEKIHTKALFDVLKQEEHQESTKALWEKLRQDNRLTDFYRKLNDEFLPVKPKVLSPLRNNR